MTELETDQYKNAELKVYSGMGQLAETLGIDQRLLKAAKKRNLLGFEPSNRVNWAILKPEFEKAYSELISNVEDNIEYWKKENLKEDNRLKKLQVKKLEKNLIEPEDVNKLMVEIAVKVSVVIKKEFTEMLPKLIGLSEPDMKVILDKAEQKIFEVLKSE